MKVKDQLPQVRSSQWSSPSKPEGEGRPPRPMTQWGHGDQAATQEDPMPSSGRGRSSAAPGARGVWEDTALWWSQPLLGPSVGVLVAGAAQHQPAEAHHGRSSLGQCSLQGLGHPEGGCRVPGCDRWAPRAATARLRSAGAEDGRQCQAVPGPAGGQGARGGVGSRTFVSSSPSGLSGQSFASPMASTTFTCSKSPSPWRVGGLLLREKEPGHLSGFKAWLDGGRSSCHVHLWGHLGHWRWPGTPPWGMLVMVCR